MTGGSKESSLDKGRCKVPVLIAAKPGRMRESLRILLKMVDGIDVIGQAGDSSSAMRMISEHRPALVLLDTNLPGEGTFSILKRIKASGSSSRYLVLTEGTQGRRDAYSAGADAALIKGFRTANLIKVVESLLFRETGTQGSDFRGE